MSTEIMKTFSLTLTNCTHVNLEEILKKEFSLYDIPDWNLKPLLYPGPGIHRLTNFWFEIQNACTLYISLKNCRCLIFVLLVFWVGFFFILYLFIFLFFGVYIQMQKFGLILAPKFVVWKRHGSSLCKDTFNRIWDFLIQWYLRRYFKCSTIFSPFPYDLVLEGDIALCEKKIELHKRILCDVFGFKFLLWFGVDFCLSVNTPLCDRQLKVLIRIIYRHLAMVYITFWKLSSSMCRANS